MGKLVYDFSHNQSRYMTIKHQFSKKTNNSKKNMIEKFLLFCEQKQVQRINNIQQKHYDQFLQQLAEKDLSTETIRKYGLAIKEFIARAHLDIRINPTKAKKRKNEKKLNKIKNILKENEMPDSKIKSILLEIEKVL